MRYPIKSLEPQRYFNSLNPGDVYAKNWIILVQKMVSPVSHQIIAKTKCDLLSIGHTVTILIESKDT